MLKKTITYTDFDGNKRTEDFYFNLMKSEIMEMDLSATGGLDKMISKIVAEQDGAKIVEIFKKIILTAYGEKSLDGKRFVKNKELSEAFSQTEAYSELFMELATDATKAAEFINGIVPFDDNSAKVTPQAIQDKIATLPGAPKIEEVVSIEVENKSN